MLALVVQLALSSHISPSRRRHFKSVLWATIPGASLASSLECHPNFNISDTLLSLFLAIFWPRYGIMGTGHICVYLAL